MNKLIAVLAAITLGVLGSLAGSASSADWSSSQQVSAKVEKVKPTTAKRVNAYYVIRYQYPYGGCPSYMMFNGYHLWLQWYGQYNQWGQYICQYGGWVN